MIAVRIPNNWTPLEVNAAITLVEAILDALWRQYPEPLEEYFAADFDYDDRDDPPLNDCDQSNDHDNTDHDFWTYEIPF